MTYIADEFDPILAQDDEADDDGIEPADDDVEADDMGLDEDADGGEE